MKSRISSEDFTLANRLTKAGIPLDPEVLKSMAAACREDERLRIEQFAGDADCAVFPLCEAGGTGFVLHLAISGLRGKTIITGWSITCAWHTESTFMLLPDPKDRGSDTYILADGRRFPRNDVLNHRIFERGVVTGGTMLRGLLVGFSFDSIPAEFSNRQRVTLNVALLDHLDAPYPQDIVARIDRSGVRRRMQTESKRRPIFDCPDVVHSKS